MSSIYDKSSLVLIPSGTKTSKVYSQVPTNGDGDFDFTRSTAATRVNADGNIEKETSNLISRSNDFSQSAWNKIDGTLTSGQAGYDGSSDAWQYTTTSTSGSIYQLNTNSGVQTFSVYVKGDGSTGVRMYAFGSVNQTAFFNLNTGEITSGNSIKAEIQDVGSGWYRCSIAFNQTNTQVRLYTTNASATTNSSGTIFIQDAQLNQGLIAQEVITTTTTALYEGITDNVPRLDYTDSSCPALLLEPQRTNLLTQSEFLGSSSWTKFGTTISANATTSPDGYVNANKVVENTANSSHGTYASASITSGAVYTWSAFFKAGERTKLRIFAQTGVTPAARFDLSTGTIISVDAGVTASIVDYGSGWYRCILSVTSTSTPAYFNWNMLNDAGDVAYTGDGTSGLYAYGFQLEAGSYATSYIPTYGTSVTRNQDRCVQTGISDLIGQTEGTLFIDLVLNNPVDSVNRVISVTGLNWAGNGSFRFDFTAQNKIIADVTFEGANSVAIQYVVQFNQGDRYKVALVYKENDCKMYVNGVLAGVRTSTGGIPACSQIHLNELGAGFGGPFEASNHNQVLLFKTRLTDQELIDLTTI